MHHSILILAWAALLLAGCDYGRSSRYKLTLQPQPRQAIGTTSSVADESRTAELLQSALQERGFVRLRDDYWTRRGADVWWLTNAPGELTLCIGAFGAKREVRESFQAESELIRFLLSQPGIQVAPVTRTESQNQ